MKTASGVLRLPLYFPVSWVFTLAKIAATKLLLENYQYYTSNHYSSRDVRQCLLLSL